MLFVAFFSLSLSPVSFSVGYECGCADVWARAHDLRLNLVYCDFLFLSLSISLLFGWFICISCLSAKSLHAKWTNEKKWEKYEAQKSVRFGHTRASYIRCRSLLPFLFVCIGTKMQRLQFTCVCVWFKAESNSFFAFRYIQSANNSFRLFVRFKRFFFLSSFIILSIKLCFTRLNWAFVWQIKEKKCHGDDVIVAI